MRREDARCGEILPEVREKTTREAIGLKTCPECGEKCPDEDEFCTECGHRFGGKKPKGASRKGGAVRAPRALRSPFDEFVIGGVALMAGLLVSWVFAILGMAVPSVLQTVTSEVQVFLPQFIIFLIVAIVGLRLAKWGAEEMGNPKLARGVLKYSGVLALVVALVVVAMRWSSGFQFGNQTFWFRLAYIFGAAGMGLYSIKVGRGS